MKCTVADIIKGIRCEILDPEADIWSDELITDYIRQAYTHILSLRPDVFSETKEITLERGKCFQEICEDCETILDILGIDGQDCIIPDKESTQDNLDRLSRYFNDSDCKAVDDDGNEVETPFTPKAYKLIESHACGFKLSEPTPEDRDVVATVVCMPEPIDFCVEEGEDITLPDIICGRAYEGFKHLLLSKIYATDRKADNLIELSQLHFKYWQDFRDWWFRVDFSKHEADWYLYRQKTSDRSD